MLAGTNGAGKSSVAGALFRAEGVPHFDPDLVARDLLASGEAGSLQEANAAGWEVGRRLLASAIAEPHDFAFETTLGGNTIPLLLAEAADRGLEVRIWYVGLRSPELHLSRVRARVRSGGHDIPEAKIRERYDASRRNLIRLLPKLAELRLFDNSAPRRRGRIPPPMLVLHLRQGRIVSGCAAGETPEWAKPIVAAAILLARH